jgi:hypothetical protein
MGDLVHVSGADNCKIIHASRLICCGFYTVYILEGIQEECLKLLRTAMFLENLPPKLYIN